MIFIGRDLPQDMLTRGLDRCVAGVSHPASVLAEAMAGTAAGVAA